LAKISHSYGRLAPSIIASILLFGVCAPVPAQAAADREPAQIVAEFCGNCHAPTLTGNMGPNLLDAYWNHGGDDASIVRNIQKGFPESGMTPFAGILTESEIRGLVAYLRQQGAAFAAGKIALPPPPRDVVIRSERQTFRLETIVANLDTPWGMVFLPDDQILVTERPGRLRLIDRGVLQSAPIGGTPQVFVHQDGGLLDVAADPAYAKNGWIYLAYSEEGQVADTSMTVVVRGRIREGQWVDQETLFRAPPECYYTGYIHYGCRFLFDAEGHLFFTIGDRGHAPDAQDLSKPTGKIHRILADGRIPSDNPFVGRTGALPSIWSYGHRHPQGLSFHPVTGRLWESEHGPTGGDELNVISPGYNYGWPVISNGTDPVWKPRAGTQEGMQNPVVFWTPAIAPSGIAFYTGNRFPAWKNQLFVTALGGQRLLRIETEGDQVTHQEILFKDLGRVRAVVTAPDGLLYVALNAPGRIARLVPVATPP